MTAQIDSTVKSAADGISVADLTRHLGVLAADSMRSRVAEGAILERTAQYIATQFRSLGLAPIGGDSTLIQWYSATDHLMMDTWQSSVWFAGQPESRGKPVLTEQGAVVQVASAALRWDTDILLAVDTVLPYASPVGTVIAGPHTRASVRQANLQDKVVIYIPPSGTDSATQRQIVEQLRQSNHVVIIPDEDSAAFVQRFRAPKAPVILDKYGAAAQAPRRWVLYLREAAVRRALRSGGVDVAEVRASPTPVTREVTMLIWLNVVGAPNDSAPTAPNVVGLLPARDDRTSGYVVFTAPMDRAGGNRASGTAADVAGLLELARAFRRLRGLRYPVLFAAVSGSSEGFRGSRALIKNLGVKKFGSTSPSDRLGTRATRFGSSGCTTSSSRRRWTGWWRNIASWP